MLDSISPYALLKASKPKPAPTVTTAYDLFSTAQSVHAAEQSPEDAASKEAPEASARREQPQTAAAMPLVPRSRTHYISEIKSRHSEALRRAYPPAHS